MKRLLCLLLTAAMVFPLGVNAYAVSADAEPAQVSALADTSAEGSDEITVTASGYCGDEATWTLTSDGVLTIGGEGEMYNGYGGPWDRYSEQIVSLVIENGEAFDSDNSSGLFMYCDALSSITVKEGEYTVSENVLYDSDMTRLILYPSGRQDKTFTIPDTVETVDECAFGINVYLEEMTIPAIILDFPTYNLDGLENLKAFKVSGDNWMLSAVDGVLFRNDGEYLIAYPAGKTDTTYSVPEGTTSINSIWNQHLETVNIPTTMENLDAYSFRGCGSLKSINVASGNEYYASEDGVLFSKDKTVLICYPSGKTETSYAIPDTVSELSESAFEIANELKEITIPASLENIPEYTFVENVSLEKFIVDDENEAFVADANGALYSYDKSLLIKVPSKSGVTVFTVPNTVKTIAGYCFSHVDTLTEVTIPDSVLSIGSLAFFGNSSLAKLTVNGNPKFTGRIANGYATGFTIYGLTGSAIEDYAEQYNIDFSSIGTYEAQITATGTYGSINWSYRDDGLLTFTGTGALAYSEDFENTWHDFADGITEMVIEEGITEIGDEMFYECRNLAEVTIPKSVKLIGEWAFNYNVRTINGYNGTAAELYALVNNRTYNCLDEKKEAVVITDTYNENFTWTLTNRGKLTVSGNGSGAYELGIRDSYDSSDKPWDYYGEMIRSIEIGGGISYIGRGVFGNCYRVENVMIAETVEEIGDNAFNDYSLDTISGYNGSAAELYALMNDVDFECLDEAREVELFSDTYGESIEWAITNRGKLTVTGEGPVGTMDDYTRMPWSDYSDFVRSIVIGEGITLLGQSVFNNCNRAESAVIPESVKEIDESAFSLENLAEISAYNGTVGELYAKVRGIDFICLDGEDTEVVLYRGKYGEDFTWNITDSAKLTVSGTGALGTVDSWEDEEKPWDVYYQMIGSIEVGDGITLIGNDFFGQCYNVTEVKVAKSVKMIGEDGFSSYNLEKISGYNGSYAELYAKGNGLDFVCLDGEDTRVNFDSGTYGTLTWSLSDTGVLTIGGTGMIGYEENNYEDTEDPWLKYASAVGSIVVGEGITKLGMSSFGYSYRARSITLPESLTSIENYAISLDNIESLTIPAGVTSIGKYAFQGCSNLEEINVAEENKNYTSVSGVLFTEDMKTLLLYPHEKSDASYAIPEGVATVGDGAIDYYHQYLKILTLPASLTVFENIYEYDNIQKFVVTEGNTVFSSDSTGVLFNAGKTELIKYPRNNTADEYVIPDTVVSIGYCAFDNCWNLETLTVPKSVTEINEYAFGWFTPQYTIKCYNNSAMEKLAQDKRYSYELLDEDTVEIVASGTDGANIRWTLYDDGSMVFEGTGGMTDGSSWGYSNPWYNYTSRIGSLVIGEGITSVGDYSFYSCSNLSSVTLPSTLLDVGEYGFAYCYALTSVTLPASVTLISDYAFAYTNISSINIPGSMKEIGEYAFAECDITSVNIPASVEVIADNAFDSCAHLTAVNVDAENTNFSSDGGVLFDKNKTMLMLYPSAKADESYTVPSTVTQIIDDAFSNAQKLKSVVIPESVTQIGDNAFVGARNLSSMTVYGKTTVFGHYVFGSQPFANCTMYAYNGTPAEYYAKDCGLGFAAIGGGEDTRDVRDSGADCGEGLTWTLYDDGVLEITGNGGMNDFSSSYAQPWSEYRYSSDTAYSAIRAAVAGEGVTHIGSYAFGDISSLASVTLPDTLVSIGAWAFNDDSALTAVTLPESLTSIGNYAFYDCWGLTEISIPASVTSIGEAAFSSTSNVASITVDAANTAYTAVDNVLFDKNQTVLLYYAPMRAGTEYTVPSTVTELAPHSMYNHKYLKTLTIPESVKKIGNSSLGSFEKITIYSKTAEFADYAIGSYYNLTVYGYNGSTAETYCDRNGVNFVTLDEDTLDIIDQGSCGANVTYILDENGLLTISGTGAMADYDDCYNVPWYDNMDYITDVSVGSGITHIGNYSFQSSDSVENVTLPEGLISIGKYAFNACDELEEISFPDSLTTIGEYAFAYSGIKEASITKGVTSVVQNSFLGCSSYTVDAANTVYSAVDGVLMSKDKTVLISYPRSKSGASYTVPDYVTKIGDSAFYYVNGITSIDVHENVTEIGGYAFSSCTNLVSLTIRGMTTVIDSNVLNNRNSGLVIYAHDKSTAEEFAKSIDVTFVSLDGTDEIENIAEGSCGANVRYTLDENGLLTISGTGAMDDYTGYDAAPWSEYASRIRKVVVSEGVTHIGAHAFNIYTGFTELTLPGTLVSIGSYAFYDCYDLKSLTLPANLVSIGDCAFAYCYDLTKAEIPAKVTSIGISIFQSCSNFAEITVADANTAYTDVDNVLFTKDMKTLVLYAPKKTDTEYALPETVEVIAEKAFYGAAELTTVYAPSALKKIGDYAFDCCYSLTLFQIEAMQTEFGNDVFNYRSIPTIKGYDNSSAEFYADLNGITFEFIEGEDTVGIMGSGECGDNLTWKFTEDGVLTVSGTGEMYDDVPWADFKTMIKSVVIENGVTSIGSNAFYSCEALTSVELPESLLSIGSYAFASCTVLEEIELPAELQNIGSYAFMSCESLTELEIPGTVSNIGSNAFVSCSSMTEFTVGEGNEYFAAEDGVLFDIDKITLIMYPAKKTDTTYTVPKTVSVIEDMAFSSVDALTEVTVGENVSRINRFNFYNCQNLVQLNVLSENVSYEYYGYCLIRNNADFKVYCYDGSTTYRYVIDNYIPYEFLIPPTGANVTVTVADSASGDTLEVIKGAAIYVYSDPGESADRIRVTGKDGKVEIPFEEGRYTLQVIADGYLVRSATVVITAETKAFTIYMSKDPIMQIETNVKAITKDEAVAAGIDPGAYGNKQIYECTAVLEFVPDIKYYCVDGEVISYTPKPIDSTRMLHVVAEGIYLIVPSQVSWLKEMFEVQLIVTNTSANETLEDVIADIDIPYGLSLAVMTEEAGQQSEYVDLGDINPGKNAEHKWYIAGDREGTYYLNGVVRADRVGGGVTEEIAQNFTTKEPITVLAGSAMELKITAERYAKVGNTYRMKYELTNTSDKSLYDVSLNVFGGRFYEDYDVSDIIHIAETGDFSADSDSLLGGFMLTDEDFKPNEKLAGMFKITFGAGIDLEFTDYILRNIFTVTGAGSTTEIPTTVEIVDSLETHQWGTRQITKEPTCTEFGAAKRYCLDTGCGDYALEPIDPLGHDYGDRVYDPMPTCTAGGYSYRECSRCEGITEEIYYDALGHDFTDPVVTKDPTCTETGIESGTCTRCGETTTQELPMLDHDWSDWTVTDPGDCETDGKQERECTICGGTEEDVIEAPGHDWSDWTTDPVPTCTSEGSKTRSCGNCTEYEIVTLVKLPHSYGELILVEEGTCTTATIWKQICSVCEGETYTYSEISGHMWSEWSEAKEATCEENGTEIRVCGICKGTETRVVSALGHDMGDWTVETEPGCITDGLETRSCSRCGNIETRPIPANGHSYPDEWTVRTEATCSAEGVEYRECPACGAEETRPIEKVDHIFDEKWTVDKEPGCTEDGSESRHCANCDAFTDERAIGALGHDYGGWVEMRKATCRQEGIQRRTCANCGGYIEESIPKGEHDWDNGVVTKKPTLEEFGVRTYTCLICGDTRTEQVDKLILQDMGFAVFGSYVTTYGKYVSLNIRAANDSPNGGAVTYSSSVEDVATIDEFAKITIHNSGTTVIKATAVETDIYAETTDEFKLIINKAALTVTPAAAEIYYGEAWNGTDAAFTAEGFVYEENESVLDGDALITSDYEQGGNVGEYTLSISGITARNYNITYNTGALKVLKAKDYTIEFSNLTHRKGHVTPVKAATVPADDSAVFVIEYEHSDGSWSEEIPDIVGEIEIRAALISADNIEVSETLEYTYGTMTVKGGATIGGDSDGVSAEIVDNGENLEITLNDDDAIDQIINKAADNSGEIVIDVTSNDGAAESKNLTIPGDLVEALADSEKVNSMTVVADQTEVTMDANVLNTITDTLKDKEESKLNFRVDAVDVKDLNSEQQEAIEAIGGGAAVLELTMTVTHKDENGETVEESLHELRGDVKVRAAYDLPEDMQNKRVIVCYVSDDGSVTYLRATYNDGYVEFSTYHFSNYVISTVLNCIGDVNGDGKPDKTDLLILQRYFAGWPGYEVGAVSTAVDHDVITQFDQAEMIDGEKGLTRKDLMILARYLGTWGGEYDEYFASNKIPTAVEDAE